MTSGTKAALETQQGAEREYLAGLFDMARDPALVLAHAIDASALTVPWHRTALLALSNLATRHTPADSQRWIDELVSLEMDRGVATNNVLELTNVLPKRTVEQLGRALLERHLERRQEDALARALATSRAGQHEAARAGLLEELGALDRGARGPLATASFLSGWGDDIIGTPPPDREWLLEREDDGPRLEGFLPLHIPAMISAAGGMGKTWLAIQLAIAVAIGGRWLGCFRATSPGNVAMFLAEEDRDEVHRRFHQVGRALELDLATRELAASRILCVGLAGNPSALLENDGAGNLTDSGFLRELRSVLHRHRCEWRLLVLDPLARFAPSDAEKDNAAATRFVQAYESLIDVPGRPTVLVMHHTGKASRGKTGTLDAQAARGVTGLVDGPRWSATLGPSKGDHDVLSLRVTKANGVRHGKPVMLSRTRTGVLRPLNLEEEAALPEGDDA